MSQVSVILTMVNLDLHKYCQGRVIMNRANESVLCKRLGKGLLATFAALCLLLVTSITALASTVNISDQGNILNASQIRSEASALSKPVNIYTVANFSGSSQAFVSTARQSIKTADDIVIAIKPGYMTVVGGKNVGLSNSQYTDAVKAFQNDYKSRHDYTSATIATIHSLRDNLSGGGIVPGVGGGNGIFGTLCCVGLIAVIAIAVFAIVRRRGGNRGGMFGGFGGGFRPNNPPAYNPYNQGQQYPPNYQGQYPPNYQGQYPPQQGMNPLAAGGLGAAAGGLIGYELGKNAGERNNNGGDGGGAGGNFDVGGGGGGGFGGGDGGGFGGGGDGGGFGGGDGGGFGGGDSGGFGGGDSGGGGGDGGSF